MPGELNQKEKSIVDLINQLSEIANDESTTQDAIDRIMENIRQNTHEDIQSQIEGTEKVDDVLPTPPPPPITAPAMKASPTYPLLFTRIREVKKPCKAHPTDAGIDFFVPDAKAWDEDFMKTVMKFSRNPIIDGIDGVSFKDGRLIVAPGAHVAIPSGIKTIIPRGYGMMMVNKSGIATKLKLDHSACLIDSEYRDELIFCFFNHNHTGPVEIEPGMKITQGLIVPIIDLGIQEVLNCVYDDIAQAGNDRGGGFGSSGK